MITYPQEFILSKHWIKKYLLTSIIIGLFIFLMMYLSVNGLKNMTSKDKKNSLKKSLRDIKRRLDVKEDSLEEKELSMKIEKLINSL